ncbi:MAG: hypothetical protein Q8920_11925 [Bacillota bacterium]|nr:hypothetical protein [Bacillota bacterium]
MGNLLITLIIGLVAGVIDIIPMILQKLDRYSIISAFVQWLVVAFVIININFGVEGWLKGLIVAILMALPIVILVMKDDAKSVLPILIMCSILGSLTGYIGDKYVR